MATTPNGSDGASGQQPADGQPAADGHVDSEQLALLAMGAPTPAGVAEHVAACPVCAKDLSVLRSLLDADGPDGADSAVAGESDTPAPLAAALRAQADGNDSVPLSAAPPRPRQAPTGVASESPAAEHHRNPWLVVAAVAAVLLAVALLAFLFLR